MSKRERREREIRPRGKRRGGILTLLDPDENPITDDLIKTATPKLRKQMETLRELHAYQIAHPMDPRPMREADALARKGLPEPKQLQPGLPRWIVFMMTCHGDSAIRINAIPSSSRFNLTSPGG